MGSSAATGISMLKIATNALFCFPLKDGYDFFPLGERTSDASMIVLMLQKNWGIHHVDQIEALTNCISQYPKEIPCFIIGCETKIPNTNLKKYLNKKRDEAVRALCDEVLERSLSIGVRGEITYLYLTQILGYDSNRIDIIYDPNSADNTANIISFLQKNDSGLAPFSSNILSFQISPPRYLFERYRNTTKDIHIRKPYVTMSEERTRLNAEIEIDGQTKVLWCETDHTYSPFFLFERVDAFLCVILPFAMRNGKDIVCHAPVTEQFLHNLTEILIPQLATYDSRLHNTKISAAGDPSGLRTGRAVATGMSCGVDSFYTASLYHSPIFESMKLTHLYVGNYLYGNEGKIYDRALLVADEMGLPLVSTTTNITQELPLPHLPTHFFKAMFGVLSLRKFFRIYYYSTTRDFSQFELRGNATECTRHIELLLLYTFSCEDFQIVTGGVKKERIEKLRALGSFDVAAKYLNVCLNPHGSMNCGKCEKCARDLLYLDMLGFLDRFRNVFPVDEYSSNRIDYLSYLCAVKESGLMPEVYRFFAKSEPDLMKQAEEKFGSHPKNDLSQRRTPFD